LLKGIDMASHGTGFRLRATLVVGALMSFMRMAQADGLPEPVYRPLPVAYERPYGWGSWSGFYIGANAGYAWSPNNNQLALLGDFPTGLSPEGGFVGGQIGYNWQFGRVVVGAEADLQGADISDRVQDLNFGDNFHSRLDWFGTVRGRLGYAFDRTLVFATAGFAFGGVHNNVDGAILPGSPYKFDGTATGYVLGAGVEYKLNPAWSVKGEYQYINLGTNDPTNPVGLPYSGIGGGGNATVHDDEYHSFRLGVNYRFGSTSF
jgi:outer membrane immunogenic protein